jgi:hypothetical protein
VDVVVKVLWFAGGLVLLVLVFDSALRTFLLPRGESAFTTRMLFSGLRIVFQRLARLARSYEGRDRVMALYAPVVLLVLPFVWLAILITAFMLFFHAFGVSSFERAYEMSGSSIFTLGFVRPPDVGTMTLAFLEAASGLALLALLIAYLPTIYGAFSRSPFSHRSWVTASGAVLDAASLRLAAVDLPFDPQAGFCVRGGVFALRAIAGYFGLPYDADPAPTDETSISEDEFHDACDQLVAAGIPVRADRAQAWHDFNGWRVNYDQVLIALAGLVMAPYAPWSSDRSLRYRRPTPHQPTE